MDTNTLFKKVIGATRFTVFSISVTAVLLAALSESSIAAECDNCSRPRITLFDCKVTVAKPPADSVRLLTDWYGLFWCAAGIKDYVHNIDQTRECATFLDGAFFTTGDTASNSIKFGLTSPNLPPQTGPARGGSYLITGSVEGTPGNYKLTAELQVAKSREVVASATKNFTSGDSAIAAGRMAAGDMGPIVEKIRAFEKTKRTTGHPYALQPSIELRPAKSAIDKKESVEVEISLWDCDGTISTSPLANRPVELLAEGGTFTPEEVTTDDEGKAKATFTAGDKEMQAPLQAMYRFQTAAEDTGAADGGFGAITITAPSPTKTQPSLWQVSGTIVSKNFSDQTMHATAGSVVEHSSISSNNESRYTVSGIIRNIGADSLNIFKSDTAPLSCRLTGSHNEFSQKWSYQKDGSGGSITINETKTASGSPFPSTETSPSIEFTYRLTGSTGKNNSVRSLSIRGWDIKGPSTNVGQRCDRDGCKDLGYQGEISGAVEEFVGSIYNDDGVNRDTSYTSGSEQRTVSSHSNINIDPGDSSFVIQHYFKQVTRRLPSESSIAETRTATAIDQITIRISRIGSGKNSVIPTRSPSPACAFNPVIRSRGSLLEISVALPEPGDMSIRLFDLRGRLVQSLVRKACSYGNTSFYIDQHTLTPGVAGVACELLTPKGTAHVFRQHITTAVIK